MMRWALFIFICGCPGKSRFDRKFSEEACLLLAECEVLDLEGYATERACVNDLDEFTDDCDDYDRKQARACLKAIRSFDCDELHDRGMPPACNTVCTDD